MAVHQVTPEPIPDHDDSTVYTATTPPETVDFNFDLPNDDEPFGGAKPSFLLVPYPGPIFIIRSVSCGRVITLLDGQIKLTKPGALSSIRWQCVETKGWLGFRNTDSGKFLGHDGNGRLRCSAERHQGWEYFCTRMRPTGGVVLLMTHWERLWHVGSKTEQGVETLAKIEEGGSGGLVWEFVEVKPR